MNSEAKRSFREESGDEARRNTFSQLWRERGLPCHPKRETARRLSERRLKCTGLRKLYRVYIALLGGEGGKGEKEKHIMLIVLRLLSHIVVKSAGKNRNSYKRRGFSLPTFSLSAGF